MHNLEWIKSLMENENPWVLTSRVEDSFEHRDAFIGNGYIGQRVGPSGDGSDFKVGSASFLHGFWNDRTLMALPIWSVLRVHECDYGSSIMWRQPAFCRKNYCQKLFLREGKVETSYTHETNKLNSKIKMTTFLSRVERNLGVIKMEIESFKDNAIHAIETTLDGFVCDAGEDWSVELVGNRQSLSGKMGVSKYPIQIVSDLEYNEMPILKEEHFESDRKTTRILYFKINKGHKLTIIKWVSIRSREDGENLKSAAIKQVEDSKGQYESILAQHQKAWEEYWQQRIEVPDLAIQGIVNASLYYFGSNLRKGVHWSLGPAGLTGRHWGGRAFWDADLWMHPVIALLHPELGSCFSEYRIRTLEGALLNAKKEGRAGACIAWESAETGEEKVSIPAIHEQRHVNTDVAFMLRLQSLITGDEKWLKEKALPVIRAIAEYWASRVEFDVEKKAYVLKNIYCSDEYAGIRDNNAHTNFCAGWALKLAIDLEKRFGGSTPELWQKIADNMYMPWNENRQLWDEYEGWVGHEKIKQADATLMIYPYEKPMSDDLKQRLTDYYAEHYEANKIMMGSSIDGVIHCELKRPDKAWLSLMDMIPHFRPPFLCVSERPTNEIINFLTGIGGVLQVIVMGFAGVRVHEEELLVEPSLPKHWDGMRIIGLHYQGAKLNLDITQQGVKVSAQVQKQGKPFKVVNRKRETLFTQN